MISEWIGRLRFFLRRDLLARRRTSEFDEELQVLKNQFSEAAKLMSVAGFDAKNYRELPISERFRQAKEFSDAFSGQFGHAFEQNALSAVRDVIDEIDRSEGEVALANEATPGADLTEPEESTVE